MSPVLALQNAFTSTLSATYNLEIMRRVVILPSTTIFPEITTLTVNALTDSGPIPSTVTVLPSTTATETVFMTVAPSTPSINSACGIYTNVERSQTTSLACSSSTACTRSSTHSNVFVYCPAPTAISSALGPQSVTNIGNCWMDGLGCCSSGEKAGVVTQGPTSLWICVPGSQKTTVIPGQFEKVLASASASSGPAIAATTAASSYVDTEPSAALLTSTLSNGPSSTSSTSPSSVKKSSSGIIIGIAVTVGVVAIIGLILTMFLCHRFRKHKLLSPSRTSKRSSNESTAPILTGDRRKKPTFSPPKSPLKDSIQHIVPLKIEPIWSDERKASLRNLDEAVELAQFGSTPTKAEAPVLTLPGGTGGGYMIPSRAAPSTAPEERYKDILARMSNKEEYVFLRMDEFRREVVAKMSSQQRRIFLLKSSPEQQEMLLAVKSIGDERQVQKPRVPSLKLKESDESLGKGFAAPKGSKQGDSEVEMKGTRKMKSEGDIKKRMSIIVEKIGEC